MKALADWYPGAGTASILLDALGFIAIFVALTWAAELFLVRRRAALRSALWLAALAGVLLAPALALIGSRLPWRVTVLPTEDAPRAAGPAERPPHAALAPHAAPPRVPPVGEHLLVPETAGSREVGAFENKSEDTFPRHDVPSLAPLPPPVAAEASRVAAEPPAQRLRTFAMLALFVWGLGSLYLGVRLLDGVRRVRRLWGRLRPLDGERWAAELTAVARTLSVARLPELWLSPDVRSPVVAGLFPPRVVLPEALPECGTPEQLRAILVHECAHVVRRDPWINLLQRLAVVLFWVHPLVHLLNRRLDRAREEVCDNHALACTDAPTYAETLLAVAQLCYPVPRLEGYLTMMPHQYNLERRVADLLEERRDTATRLTPRQRLGLLASLVLLLVAASSVGLYGAPVGPTDLDQDASAKQSTTPAAAQGPREPAAVKLTGQAVAADGSPAAGAVVWAAKFDYGPYQRRETVADLTGRYTLELAPGRWSIWARRGTQGGEGPARHESVEITASRTPEPVTIRLEERGTFRGRLLEAETGKPIAGGQLFLDAGLILLTAADGRFEVGGLYRGAHEGFIVAPGRMRLRVLFDSTARAVTELDVPVPRGGKLVGRVTDVDGKVIAGAYVGRQTSGSYFSINGLFAACDAEGRFEYDDAVSPDQPTRLTAFAPGYSDEERGGLSVTPDGKPLELHFRLRPKPGTRPGASAPDEEKRRTVSGVVRRPNDRPAAGVVVRWGYQPVVGAIETKTDDEGRFRLVVPDRADMLAILPRAFPPEFPHVVAGGDQTIAVTLKDGHTVRGRVLDDTKKPIKDVRVIASVGSPDPRLANPFWLTEAAGRTDADGKFELKGVPDGARFDFLKPGLSEVRFQSLDFARADNVVTLLHGGAVRGRVVDRDGKPIRSFRVLVSYPRERQPDDQSTGFFAGYSGMGVRFTSDDGSFVLSGVGAGSVYRITALADGHGEAVADRVTAVPVNRLGTTEVVTLRAGPPVALRVRAVAADGKPVAGARVTLVNGSPGLDQSFSWGYHNASWEDMIRDRTAADGWANFPALSFGSATVLVQAPGHARVKLGWRNRQKELTVELTPEAVVAGTVHDAAGRPVKTFHVNVTSGGDQVSVSIGPDAQGRFRITELPAGAWTVIVRGADGRSMLHQEEIRLKAGETKELKIETNEE